MKSVGQQLQEARSAKNWTPELAARETKIKVERIRDLENDDYSHFSSPTYARGFVRTYARALGLDEYKILRQLDTKLPEDDTATFVPEGGMPYVPEPHSKALHVTSAPRTGLYVVVALGLGVMTVIAFVLFQAYRAGELPRYFAGTSSSADSALTPAATNLTQIPDNEAPQHALPVDPNDTTHSVRALPVDLNALPGPAAMPASVPTVAKAEPVTPAVTNAVPSTSAAPSEVTVHDPTPVTVPNPAPSPVALPVAQPVDASDDSGGKPPPRALPVDPNELAAAENSAPGAEESPSSPRGKRLVLTASRDSFVRVTALDSASHEVLYDSVLRRGQSLSFGGKRYSLYVSVPSAVDIVLDGVYYGPHSDRQSPETFPIESHQP